MTYSTFWGIFSTLIFNPSVECLISLITFNIWGLFLLLWLFHFVHHLWQLWRCPAQISLQGEPAGRSAVDWEPPGAVMLGSTGAFNPSPTSWEAPRQRLTTVGTRAWGIFHPSGLAETFSDCTAVWKGSPSFPILLPSPSPFKAVRPTSQTEGSLCLLLFPPLFIFHRHYPQYIVILLTFSWLLFLWGLKLAERPSLALWIY